MNQVVTLIEKKKKQQGIQAHLRIKTEIKSK